MTKSTRYIALGSTAIVVFGLCTGLVAYYGGIPSLTASRVGPAELAYVPADAGIVAFADVRDVMNSELRQKLREVLPGDQKGREDLQRLTGIDVEKDIDRVVATIGAGGQNSSVAFLSGRFNPSQIESLARSHGGQVVEYRGKRLVYGMKDDKEEQPAATAPRAGGNHHAALAFLEPNVLAIGAEEAVRKAIDTQASGQNVTGNTELMRIIGTVASGNNVWAVGRMDAFMGHLPKEVSSRMPAVQWFSATGRVNGGIHASLRAEARDDQAAENLRQVVQGGLALIKMQSADPQFAALANSIRLEGTGKTVAVSFTVPSEMFNVLISQGPRGMIAK
ncbi:MAG: DUF3352 domain-containing protein [Acidobacteriota bacterium]|nr:DUF3352 domain-containing protein [Acidobacteriota bacterium]